MDKQNETQTYTGILFILKRGEVQIHATHDEPSVAKHRILSDFLYTVCPEQAALQRH